MGGCAAPALMGRSASGPVISFHVSSWSRTMNRGLTLTAGDSIPFLNILPHFVRNRVTVGDLGAAAEAVGKSARRISAEAHPDYLSRSPFIASESSPDVRRRDCFAPGSSRRRRGREIDRRPGARPSERVLRTRRFEATVNCPGQSVHTAKIPNARRLILSGRGQHHKADSSMCLGSWVADEKA